MAMVDSVPSQCMNQIAKCHLINLLVLLFLVMIRFNKAEDNLTWRIEKKALKYGEDLRLYCQVEKCCTKSAGWGKWTSDDKFNTIFIDVKDFLNDGSSKYGGGIEKTGWFLIIRNITKNDLNTSYSCTYGFQVSKKKMLLEEDAFSGPSTTILIEQTSKETEIIPDASSIDGKQEILMKISHLIYIFIAIVAVVVFTVVGITIAHCTKKCRNNGDKAAGHTVGQSVDGSDIPMLKTSDNVLPGMEHYSNDSGIIAAAGHTIGQSADASETPMLTTSDNVLPGMEHYSNDSGIIAAAGHTIGQSADRSETHMITTSDNVLPGMEHYSNDSGIIAAAGNTTKNWFDRYDKYIPEFNGTDYSGCSFKSVLPYIVKRRAAEDE